MDFEKLKTFVVVCDYQNFSLAAQMLFTTQPNVTKQIKRLEQELGVGLIVRDKRQFELTLQGKYLLVFARSVLEQYQQALSKLEQIGMGDGLLTIGTTHLIATSILPKLLLKFTGEYPQIKLNLQVERSKPIVKKLIEQELDCALLSEYIVLPEEVFERKVIKSDKLVVIVPKHHRLANQKTCTIEQLNQETFISKDSGSSLLEYLVKQLNAPHFLTTTKIGIGDQSSIKQAVEQGLGISILSEHLVAEDVAAGHLHMMEIEHHPLKRDIHLIYQRKLLLKDSTKKFIDLVVPK